MLPGDAYLWSKYVDDEALQNKFIQFTEKQFDKQRGYYGIVGDRTVIKNCRIIKDVHIGTDAYLKGANKLKNLTINSDEERTTQIGEGCEIVNGIVGYGCRIFYGSKAVRFVMASHSQLKYGARLINSYLGNNSTISCCEVLNSLIFPAHEQHHNNSFLCASLVMGQSNIAAGATIGSNHNSRSADGEIVAGRGFWPGLCVSLKHNSKFAAFTILAKGDFPAELNIPIPFSLVSNDVANDKLVIMPGYWFMYNMYALARNTWKYLNRDRRTQKIQNIEYDYLAPDTVNEIFEAIKILSKLSPDDNDCFYTDGFESSNRKAQIIKQPESLKLFSDLVIYYGATQLLEHIQKNNFASFQELKKSISTKITRSKWVNLGGQLMKVSDVEKIKQQIKTDKIQSWEQVHTIYKTIGNDYDSDKLEHAYTSLLEILNITSKQFTAETFSNVLQNAATTKEWMCKGIYESREKDYSNPFRKMVYDTKNEMEKVIGKIEDNTFIQQQAGELDKFKKYVKEITKKLEL
jgi:predicted RNA-binding protein with EMAP domain